MSSDMRIAVRGENPPLAMEFDPRGRAAYLRLSNEAASRTVEIEEGVLADYDGSGSLIGFELLGLDRPGIVEVLARLKRRFAAEAPELASVEVTTA